MPLLHTEPAGPRGVRLVAVPHQSARETNAALEREWTRQRKVAEAQVAAEQAAEDTRLEIAGVDLFHQLGKAVAAVTGEESWVGLAEEIDRLVEQKGLSSRHGKELNDRLLRVAKDRGWVHA